MASVYIGVEAGLRQLLHELSDFVCCLLQFAGLECIVTTDEFGKSGAMILWPRGFSSGNVPYLVPILEFDDPNRFLSTDELDVLRIPIKLRLPHRTNPLVACCVEFLPGPGFTVDRD